MCNVKMRIIYNKEAPHTLYSYSVTGLSLENNLQNSITTNFIFNSKAASNFKYKEMNNKNHPQQISIIRSAF